MESLRWDRVGMAFMCRAIPQSSGSDEPCCDSTWPVDGSPARGSWISVVSHQSRTVILCDTSSSSEGKRNKIWGKHAPKSTLDWNLWVAAWSETSYTCEVWGMKILYCGMWCHVERSEGEKCREGEERKEYSIQPTLIHSVWTTQSKGEDHGLVKPRQTSISLVQNIILCHIRN
jgi:hypothetical protein